MMRAIAVSSLFCAGVVAWNPGGAQDFPNRPIRMIVPDTPGGGIDTHARIMAGAMSPILGQPVVVENKPGAGYAIGLDYVAKRVPADGYTIAAVLVQGLVVLPLTAKNLNFDPLTDLPPFIGLTESRLVFGSSPKRGWKTIGDMVAYAKANPGKLTYGSNGVLTQIVNEAIAQGFGYQALNVPYSSGGGIMQAIAAGQVDVTIITASSARSMGENLRLLVVTGAKQTSDFPGVPTFRELGLDNVHGMSYSINAPSVTPQTALDKLYAAAAQSIRQADVRGRLEKLAVDVVELNTETARRNTAQQAKFYAEFAKRIGVNPQ